MTRAAARTAAPPADLAALKTMTGTPFGDIMRRAVLATPGAIGGGFADSEGEMIDAFTTHEPDEWAILTAHYGVVMSQLTNAFGTWHFGSPEFFIAQHARLDVIVHAVDQGYYALLAITVEEGNGALGAALSSLRTAVAALRKELG